MAAKLDPERSGDRLESHTANMRLARLLEPAFDMQGCATFWQWEAALRVHVTDSLLRFVHASAPLQQPRSSWIWLRDTGTMVQEETDVAGERRHHVDMCHDLPVAIFPAVGFATPDSAFYRRVIDSRGKYVGSVAKKWRGGPPPWRPRAARGPMVYYSELSKFGMKITYRRFRLEPRTADEMEQVIRGANFQTGLKHDLQAWLAVRAGAAFLASQSFPSLKAAIKEDDEFLIRVAGGREAFIKLATAKAEAFLREKLAT